MWIFKAVKDSTNEEREKPKDLIIEITGSFGKYQYWLCFIIFLSKFFIAFNQLAIVFYAPPVGYTGTVDNPVYNTTVFSSTVIMEWNLIGKDSWKGSFVQTVFQFGTLVGSLGFGAASDRFGRRRPFIAACVAQFVFGVSGAYLPTYWSFTFFRFLVGVTVGGTMVVGFVIVMEFIGPEHREIVSALYQVPFNIGSIMLPLISYYFRDFRDFHLAISAPTAIFVIYFYSLPETPRWLITKNQPEKAIEILTHVAKMNNRPTDNIESNVQTFAANSMKNKLPTGTTADLFRTPNIRKNILCMAFNWVMCSYCYYGVSQYIGRLAGDIFSNVATSSSIVMGGTFISIPLMHVLGRKPILLLCHFICTFALIVLSFSKGKGWLSIASASVVVVAAFVVFIVVYLYCNELFPTVVRNAAVGFSSMSARVGSMIAPFICDLHAFGPWIPALGFAVVSFLAFFVTMGLPETKGCELTTTIEEGEAFGKKKNTTA